MAAEERILIRFDAKGDKELAAIFQKIFLEQIRLTKGSKAYEKALRKLNTQNKKLMDVMLGIQGQTRNVGGAFSVLRSKLLLASFATGLVSAGFGQFIKVASAAQEQTSKANVVFGEQSEIVRQWADGLGANVGRAGDKLLEMATTLQDTFVPMGLTRESATTLSTAMTELALDVASFNDKADADVIRDFQSALVGNHETVLKYGIKINEAALKQEAYNLGLYSGQGALAESAKLQARVNLIMQGTTDAQGDLIRTQAEYANQAKTLQANVYKVYKDFGDLLIRYIMPTLLMIGNYFANTKRLQGYAIALGLVGTAYLGLTAYAMGYAAILEKIKVNTIIASGGLVLLTAGLGHLIGNFLGAGEETENLEEQFKNIQDTIGEVNFEFNANTLAMNENIESRKKENKSIEKSLQLKIQNKLIQTEEFRILKDLSGALQSNAMLELKLKKFALQKGEELTQSETDYVKMLHKTEETLDRLKKRTEERAQRKKEETKADQLWSQSQETQKKLEQERNVHRLKRLGFSDAYIKRLKEQHSLENQIGQEFNKYKKFTDDIEQANKSQFEMTHTTKEFQKMLTDDSAFEAFAAGFDTMSEGDTAMFFLIQAQRELRKETQATTKSINEQGYALDIATSGIDKIAQATGGVSISSSEMATTFGDTYQSILDETGDANEALSMAYEEMAMNTAAQLVDMAMQASEARMQATRDEANSQLANLKEQRLFQKKSKNEQKKEEEKVKEAANAQLLKEFKAQQEMRAAGVIMDTAAAIMKLQVNPGFPAGIGLAVMAGVMGAAQLAEIKKQKPPKMAMGGLIGGLPHSAGGTLIEAERGEFVMSRNAVNTVGVENMNAINQGRLGTNPVNVSFSGNINSDDFIESEAIPKIKEAIRRGADIGVG